MEPASGPQPSPATGKAETAGGENSRREGNLNGHKSPKQAPAPKAAEAPIAENAESSWDAWRAAKAASPGSGPHPQQAQSPVAARHGMQRAPGEERAKHNAAQEAIKAAIQASGSDGTVVPREPDVPVPPSISTLLQRIYPALVMSRAAYQNPQGYHSETGWMGAEKPRLVHITFPGPLPSYATDTWAYVVTYPHEPRSVSVVFRGSFNDNNFATDYDFQLVPYSLPNCGTQCLVHRGFQAAFDSITKATADPRTNLASAVSQALKGKEPRRILCTGHSLGGSLATLCGPWAKSLYPKAQVVVHTAGSPRVGNTAFAAYFDDVVSPESIRLVHNMDPVPNWGDISDGYANVGRAAWMVRLPEGNYRVALQDRPDNTNATNADDHIVTNYMAVVTSLIGQPNTWRNTSMFAGLPDVAAPPLESDLAGALGNPFPQVLLAQGLPHHTILQDPILALPG
eukprot:jgi/Botrbrau1/1504/Bobra.178_3s0056.1